MPTGIELASAYIKTGNPDTVAVSLPAAGTPGDFSNYAPGQLGLTTHLNDRKYAPVILDSGATSATPAGVVAANQVLYWKDKSARRVTNDSRFAQFCGETANAFRNMVAGIARVAVATPGAGGTLIFILQGGRAIPVKSDGNGGIGQTAIAGTSTTAADVVPIAVGTAPTYVPIGIMVAAPSGGNVNVDVDIPELP